MAIEEVDVVIMGAGLSGIGAACHLQRLCPGKRYVILEGRDAIGGTWDLFRYPGIRSDSDMFTLGYNFKPWRGEQAIAPGPSIKAYVEEAAEEHGVTGHIRFGHRVERAEWSSAGAAWTVHATRKADGAQVAFRGNFMMMCGGYYSYEGGYTPEFPGRERFGGTVVHPQFWPEDLDYRGKQVVVIGSGATAVTLLPEIAKEAAHVVMLQRSPTYMVTAPARDWMATFLYKWLSPQTVYRFIRWRNTMLQQWAYGRSRKNPTRVRKNLLDGVRKELGPDYDVERHFTPNYDPWDQRLCLVPDSDLFEAIRERKASVVTDHIDTFTEQGILLESGRELPADVIVTATGLNMKLMGGVDYSVDGEPVDFATTYTYKGMMCSGVPNLSMTFGYINASWTLRADLTAEYVCRLLQHMDDGETPICTPALREEDQGMVEAPWISTFTPGYVQRAIDVFPRQGDREPWLNPQNYRRDRKVLAEEPIEDGVLRFTSKVDASPSSGVCVPPGSGSKESLEVPNE